MNVSIKNEKILKTISKELGITPSSFINELLGTLEFVPEDFKVNAKKLSVQSAMLQTFHQAQFANSITNEIGKVLGKYDATLEDFDFDLDRRYFWFHFGALVTEKKIDIDTVSLWLDSDGAQLRAERILRGLALGKAEVEAAKKRANEVDAYAYKDMEDLVSDELEWQFDLSSESYILPGSQKHEHSWQKVEEELDENTTLVLSIYSEELSSMPPLVKLDRMLDRFEKIVKELR